MQERILKIYIYLNISLAMFVFTSTANSQFIYYDQSDSTDWNKINQMVASAHRVQDSLHELGFVAAGFFIHEVGGKKWMTIDGRFDVFEWQDGIWKNLYDGTYHGYNYKSSLELFSFGCS